MLTRQTGGQLELSALPHDASSCSVETHCSSMGLHSSWDSTTASLHEDIYKGSTPSNTTCQLPSVKHCCTAGSGASHSHRAKPLHDRAGDDGCYAKLCLERVYDMYHTFDVPLMCFMSHWIAKPLSLHEVNGLHRSMWMHSSSSLQTYSVDGGSKRYEVVSTRAKFRCAATH